MSALASLLLLRSSVRRGSVPVPAADSYGPFPSGSVQTLNVLANDANVVWRHINILSQPSAGSAAVVNNNTADAAIEFTCASPQAQTSYTFNYSAYDGIPTLVTVIVNGSGPSAVNDDYGPFARGSVQSLPVLNNDTNLTNRTIALVAGGASGQATITNNTTINAAISFTCPSPSSTTTYTFQYTVDGSNAATVTVRVNVPVAVADSGSGFGPFAGGSTQSLDVLANDTGLINRTIGGLTQPSAGTTSITNNSTTNARIQLVCASPATQTNYTFNYTVDGSAAATVTATVAGSGGTAAPYAFVTATRPALQSLAKPGFNAANPRSAAVTDPMSHLDIFRLLPDPGQQWIDSTGANTGHSAPSGGARFHAAEVNSCWSAQGGYLWIDQAVGGSTVNGFPFAQCVIRSSDWRILRVGRHASFTGGILWWDSDNDDIMWGVNAGTGNNATWYTWNVATNVFTTVFSLPGYTVDAANTTAPNGYDRLSYSRHMRNGFQARMLRRTSDNARCLTRIDLNNHTKTPDIVIPVPGGANGRTYFSDNGTGAQISSTGKYLVVQGASDARIHHVFNIPGVSGGLPNSATTAATAFRGEVGDAGDGPNHTSYGNCNGHEYQVGQYAGSQYGTSNGCFIYWDMENANASGTGGVHIMANVAGTSNPCTASTAAAKDSFETYGAAGSWTSGAGRYAVFGKIGNAATDGGMWGVRCGLTDNGVVRYLGHPRGTFNSNSNNQMDPNIDPTGRYIAWMSNWGGAACLPYITILPAGWHSPVNSG